jgi:outer membrane protein assembly factor BamA
MISIARPYGSGEFGAVGGQLGLAYDSRDAATAATRGAHVAVEGTVYPAAWDVRSSFGGVSGEASTYLTAPISLRPTLALRAGGNKVWGAYPYMAAAFIGGNRTVRGLGVNRFEGDASAYGNAELRLPVTRLNVLAPFRLGIFGLADVGRVWLKGESSDTWHSAFGGGISLTFLNAGNTVTAAVARGDRQTGLYLGSGFMF